VRRVPLDTRVLVPGDVVAECWKTEYKNIGKAIEDIRHVQSESKFANTVRDNGERALVG
jgi:hypothetical protein